MQTLDDIFWHLRLHESIGLSERSANVKIHRPKTQTLDIYKNSISNRLCLCGSGFKFADCHKRQSIVTEFVT